MEKIRVRRQAQKHIYVHNDLSNAAYHFNKRINERFDIGDVEGISFDILAELVFLAFTIEAKINFLGSMLIEGWKERKPFNKKLKLVISHLKLNVDLDAKPYSTIKSLKELRDSLAHGKPVHLERDEEAIIGASEDVSIDLRAEWESYCTREFANQAYNDVNKIWEELLAASKLTRFETLSGGEQSITFIEKVTDQNQDT